MQLEAKKYLYDIHQAAELIAQFTAGKEFADYQREPMLRLAVERAFAIIGEALSNSQSSMPQLPRESANTIALSLSSLGTLFG